MENNLTNVYVTESTILQLKKKIEISSTTVEKSSDGKNEHGGQAQGDMGRPEGTQHGQSG